jgi:hypothetical protein
VKALSPVAGWKASLTGEEVEEVGGRVKLMRLVLSFYGDV